MCPFEGGCPLLGGSVKRGSTVDVLVKLHTAPGKQRQYLPNTWRVLFPTLFPESLEKAGPKHSTSVPFSAEVALPLSVDEKEVALVPNSDPVVTMKGLPDPQGWGASAVLCCKVHSLLPTTIQAVFPSPVTLQVKMKVSPGQVGGAAVNCPATTSGWESVTISYPLRISTRYM